MVLLSDIISQSVSTSQSELVNHPYSLIVTAPLRQDSLVKLQYPNTFRPPVSLLYMLIDLSLLISLGNPSAKAEFPAPRRILGVND